MDHAGEVVPMVKRQKVVDDRGRRWVSGALDSEEYFEQARREARAQARRTVASRLAAAARTPRRLAS
jgi:hypothetical protein